MYPKNTIQKNVSITNNDDVQYLETERKIVIEFQSLQPLIIIHNLLLPHPQVYYICTQL